MTDSIDIPSRDRRSRRMRHQELPSLPSSLSMSSEGTPKTKTARPDIGLPVDAEDDSLYSSPSSFGAPSSIGGSPALPTALKMAKRGAANDKGKGRALDVASPTKQASNSLAEERRPSWMGESIARSEHTVIDVGESDGIPRLITCVKSGQGWAWNQDLLLPSYLCDRDHMAELEHRQDPIEEIILTEEEMQGMLPQ